jgi:predicted nucleic acid-binding protein
MTLILDASAGIEIVLEQPRSGDFSKEIEMSDGVISSELYRAEIANVIWKYVKAGLLEKDQAKKTLSFAENLVDHFVPLSENTEETLMEAIRIGHSPYDILYYTLARRNGAKLLTMDKKLKLMCQNSGIETTS